MDYSLLWHLLQPDFAFNTVLTLSNYNRPSSEMLSQSCNIRPYNKLVPAIVPRPSRDTLSSSEVADGEVLAETLPSLQAQEKADDTTNYIIETAIEDFESIEIDQQIDNMPPETAPSAEQDHHFEDSVKDLNNGYRLRCEVLERNNGPCLPKIVLQVTNTLGCLEMFSYNCSFIFRLIPIFLMG
ncbi:uncharacterized protein LOC107867783 isoform X3 [Capsicum annuum]|nr:uncharacterized protein LOC107867783 isoform X3 [Capsicum annuum]